MKRLISGLFALLLSLLLVGCAGAMPEQTVVCGDLAITLPANFVDLSAESYGKDLSLVYGMNELIVTAGREDAAALKAQLPHIDALEYARLVVSTNALDAQVQLEEEIPTFTYTMGTGEESFTYLVAVFASEENFWLVQCFCPTEAFDQNRDEMWRYITTVNIR